jgi:hypothetical protein
MKVSTRTKGALLAACLLLELAWHLWKRPTSELTRLQALIKPEGRECSYRRIPWTTSLWHARQRAAAEGKPILLWTMDGNPLGDT